MNSKTVTLILYILGFYHFATGAIAYFQPLFFFNTFVSHTGAYNVHFLNDIGAAYLGAGAALMLAGYIVKWRVPFAISGFLFLGLHSLIHITEIVRGQLSTNQAITDAVTILIPTGFVGLMAFVAVKLAGRDKAE
jgi:hypothetical protein